MIDSLNILSIHKSYRGATDCAVVVTPDLRVGLLARQNICYTRWILLVADNDAACYSSCVASIARIMDE